MSIARTRMQQLKQSQQLQQQSSSQRVGALSLVPSCLGISGHPSGSRQGHTRYTGARSAGRPWVARTQFSTAVQCRNTANISCCCCFSVLGCSKSLDLYRFTISRYIFIFFVVGRHPLKLHLSFFLFSFFHFSYKRGDRRQHHPKGKGNTATPPGPKEETKQHHPSQRGRRKEPHPKEDGREGGATQT